MASACLVLQETVQTIAVLRLKVANVMVGIVRAATVKEAVLLTSVGKGVVAKIITA